LEARLFAMGGDERYVSPYLLRPLRTFEEILGGRARAVETARGSIDVVPTCCDQGVRSKSAAENHRPAPLGTAD
jgi:hypothetical protein